MSALRFYIFICKCEILSIKDLDNLKEMPFLLLKFYQKLLFSNVIVPLPLLTGPILNWFVWRWTKFEKNLPLKLDRRRGFQRKWEWREFKVWYIFTIIMGGKFRMESTLKHLQPMSFIIVFIHYLKGNWFINFIFRYVNHESMAINRQQAFDNRTI